MKLSTTYLLDTLNDCYNFTKCKKTSDIFCMERRVFYLSGMKIERCKIYILYEDLPDFSETPYPPDCLLLGFEGQPGIEKLPSDCLCVFSADLSPFVLFQQIQELFNRCDAWEENLHQIQMKEGSISQMLEASYPIFQNPILVQNLDFTVVSSCHMEELGEDEEFRSPARNMDLINSMKQDPIYNRVRELDDVFSFPDYLTGFRSLNLNIKKFGHTAFRITLVESGRSLKSWDAGFLKHLGTYVEYALLHNLMQRPSKDKTLNSILLNLLSNRSADYMSISRQLTSCGWAPEHSYLCMMLAVTYLDQQNLTENAICDYVENVIHGSCAFSFRDNIVIYVDMDLFGGSTEDITEKLIYFIRDSFLKLSLSYTVTGHMYLRKQYLQALAAHELGNAQKPYLWIHAFRDFALPYIFSQAVRQIPGSMLCHEKLLLLQAHDKEQGTEYMRTLEVYLKNHLNAVQSARELYIHRSTFLYRLERIRALLDSDLTDYDELLYLMISFYLLKEDQPKRQDDSQ